MARSAQLFFVCGNGHIFRSLEVMTSGRVRQCSQCQAIVTTDGILSIDEARSKARKRGGFAKDYIQVFSDGQMKYIPKVRGTKKRAA